MSGLHATCDSGTWELATHDGAQMCGLWMASEIFGIWTLLAASEQVHAAVLPKFFRRSLIRTDAWAHDRVLVRLHNKGIKNFNDETIKLSFTTGGREDF